MNDEQIMTVTKVECDGILFPPLPAGEIDIGNTPISEIVVELGGTELKTLLKKTRCFADKWHAPATLYYKLNQGKRAAAAMTLRFNTKGELEEYLASNRPFIYLIYHNTIFDSWCVRVFFSGGMLVSFNLFDNWYNNFRRELARRVFVLKLRLRQLKSPRAQ